MVGAGRTFKSRLNQVLRTFGYEVRRVSARGNDPFADMQHFVGRRTRPMLFDVGGNVGQTVEAFRRHFPDAIIHSFEPSPASAAALEMKCGALADVSVWNIALGRHPGRLPLFENTRSDMSSFLQLGSKGWGQIDKITEVEVTTLDTFAAEKKIAFIDILKCDTQGFELEVFAGAEGLLEAARIGMVYVEITFADVYSKAPKFEDIVAAMISKGFQLVSLYDINYVDELAGWTDALFIHRDYLKLSAAAPAPPH